ncbi:HdeD family acid-resistance protein [Microbacterium sp. P06]|uniref:HdeD family acid-resistance protein n=1 Tax=Microbacterium sp. P06 TaxID=3366949 RepID=UPI003746345C
MSMSLSFDTTAVKTIRIALGVSGALSIIAGIVILIWPGHAAEAVTAIIAIYVIVAGLVYAGLGVFSKTRHGWSRVGHIVLGALFVVAGVYALVNLAAATVGFAVFTGVLIGILWLIEGVVSLSTVGDSGSKGWTIFFAILSIVAGITLLFSPLYVVILWLFLGVSLVVLGIFQVLRAFAFGKSLR